MEQLTYLLSGVSVFALLGVWFFLKNYVREVEEKKEMLRDQIHFANQVVTSFEKVTASLERLEQNSKEHHQQVAKIKTLIQDESRTLRESLAGAK